MRQKLLILAFSLAFISNSFSQQGCTPSDACNAAPFLSCYNGYINTTAGYTAGNEPIICPNGQGWTVHNDQWFKFIPTQSTLEITVDVIGNCSSGPGIQALIHESCDTDPIDCDVDCQSSSYVGGGITFIPGKVYFLRVDGCSGAQCPIQINVNPKTAITNSTDSLSPKLEFTSGFSSIVCPSDKEYTYCANLNVCATEYNWKIESGNAVITNSGDQVIDNEPNNPGKNVSITHVGRNCIKMKEIALK